MSNAERDLSQIDPLFVIFEKHLYDFHEEEENSKEFIDNIIKDYLDYLESRKVAVPKPWRETIVEELREQVRDMLVKKTYGCLSIKEFLKKQPDTKIHRKNAQKRYARKIG